MSETDKLCKHELWELDTAIQDGYCPLCMQSRLSHLSAVNEKQSKKIEIYEKCLRAFADADYRGNRPTWSSQAFIALKLADEMGDAQRASGEKGEL